VPNPLQPTQTHYDLADYVESRFQLRFIESGTALAERRVTVYGGDLDSLARTLPAYTPWRMGRTVFLQNTDPGSPILVMASAIDRTIEIKVMGDEPGVADVIRTVSWHFEPVPVRVKWVYNAKGESVRLPVRNDNTPADAFYPALRAGGGLAAYYNRYLESDSNILVLIGPPGTGKTSFIRGLLLHAGADAIVSYDPDILSDDEIFADFMSDSERFMILEDADSFLASRGKSGNTIMHKFLNVGDGLISTRGKKIVFSTNLPSIRDIDEALLRPGRCFDILRFDRLTASEARAVRPEYSGSGPITLAELLCGGNATESRKATDRVGFV